MSTIINTNMEALIAGINLRNTHTALGESITKLSTGLRVSTAADDPGSFGIIKGLEATIATYGQASRNVADSKGVINIADGALGSIGKMLERMKVLAKQSANSTYSTSARSSMALEYTNLLSEIDRVGAATEFNGMRLLTGAFGLTAFYTHAGVRNDSGVDAITTNINTVSIVALSNASAGGNLTAGNIYQRASASALLDTLDSAISQVSRWRGKFGALSNRLEWSSYNTDISLQNTTASMSRMRDVDFADEVSTLTKNQILAQSGTAMLTQANQLPQGVVQLLG